VNEIMPKYFNQSKLTSFQRQLNLYGFNRLTATGEDRGSYYHPLFLRGRPDLCLQMHRTRIKGNGMKAAASPSTEPNFYEMEPCYGGAVLQQEQQQPGMQHVHKSNANSYKAEGEGMTYPEMVAAEEEDAASPETMPVVSPSVSHDSVFPSSVSRNDLIVPFLDRPSSKFEDPMLPSGVNWFGPPKLDQGMAMSLTSLLSPPFMRPSAILATEEDWGLPPQRDSDDLSVCMSLPMNSDVEEDEEDEPLLMPSEEIPSKFNDLMVSPVIEPEEEGSMLEFIPATYYSGQLMSV